MIQVNSGGAESDQIKSIDWESTHLILMLLFNLKNKNEII